MHRLTRISLGALLCASIPSTAGATRFVVRTSNFTFTPTAVTAAVGDTVRFQDQIGFHTATNGTGSGDPVAGTLFDFSFTAGGQFGDWIVPGALGGTVVPFFCSFHELSGMKGTITVTCPNSAPVVNGIAPQSVNENVLLTVTPSASDPNGNPFTWSGSNLPSGATVNPSMGVLSWTPSFTQSGIYTSVTLIATDNQVCNTSGQASFTITVNNVNRAPVVNFVPNQNVDANTLLSVLPSGSDPDDDAFTWSGGNLPGGSSVNPSTGELTWTPGVADAGLHAGVQLIATDTGLAQGSATFDITVNAPTGVGDANPTRFAVSAPSPFVGSLSFVIASPNAARVEAGVWSASGRLIAHVPARDVAAGVTALSWDGMRADGRTAPGGVYLLRVTAGSHTVSQRVVKLR